MTPLPADLQKPAELTARELSQGPRLRRIPELLSPAGDWDAMRAAVANGADAVFFGLDQFNARHRATNFRREELPEIVRYLHAHNVKGFLTLNTLLFSDELSEVQAYITDVASSGIDAVIVQDLGLCRLIRALAPTLHIHASTQMTLTEPRGVEWAGRTLGVTRAVLARELSLDEIRKTSLSLAQRQTQTGDTLPDLEIFVHGALCVSYSGQCLTSEALGGRSANRGQCAQACRLPYDLVVDGQIQDVGDKAYLLSPQDLAAYDLVGDLADAGVACLKIEGRLKAAHYVAATTQTYRAAIDSAAATKPYLIPPQQRADLEQTFSRGFTHGFLSGVNHQELVHARFPKSRGRRMGTVVSIKGPVVTVAIDPTVNLATSLKAGDGIVFDEGHPDQDEQGGRIFALRTLAPTHPARRPQSQAHGARSVGSSPLHLELEFRTGDLNPSAISPGAIVWKTDDPTLRKRLEHSFSRDLVVRRIPIKAHLIARVGQHLTLTLTEGPDTATATWSDKPLERANKHPATEATIREQLERLGDTPYDLSSLRADLSGDPMIPKSVLNDLRRQCVDQLLALREQRRPHAIAETDPLSRLRAEAAQLTSRGTGILPVSGAHDRSGEAHTTPDSKESALRAEHGQDARATGNTSPALHVLVRSLEQLDALLAWRSATPEHTALLAGVYADFEDVRLYKDAVARCRASGGGGVPITLTTVRIIKPREEGFTRFIIDCKPDALLVRNLPSMAVARELAPHMPLVGDYSMNVSNELTAALLVGQGLHRLVPSYDLSWKQMGAMFSRIDPRFFECVVHQHMPMFHMEHCVFSHMLSDGTDYRTCGRPCESHRVELKDRQGQPHPLLADVGCRNTLFNAAAQSALDYIPDMLALGIRHLRLELLRETPEEMTALLDKYTAVLTGKADAKQTVRSLKVLNRLGVVGVTGGTLDRE